MKRNPQILMISNQFQSEYGYGNGNGYRYNTDTKIRLIEKI